ncbi:MAG: hypothetical protein IJT30_03595 [Muribaculaceae bacterium]|nr:hypothetical protein [Muribaculaceae bacterium]
MNKFTLLMLSLLCALGVGATEYVGTTVVQTNAATIPSEGTVLTIEKTANGRYNAVMSINFSYLGYEMAIDDVTFENMIGSTGNDGYTTVAGTKNLSLWNVDGLLDMIPETYRDYLAYMLNKPIPMAFNARFNNKNASASINFDLDVSFNIALLGIDYTLVNTPVLVTFEGQSQGGEEPPVFDKGDVDGNGSIDIDDVNGLINLMLEYKTPGDYAGNPDVNGDGNYDIDDINALINLLLAQ